MSAKRQRPRRRGHEKAADGSPLGGRLLLQGIELGSAVQPGLGAVFTLRVRGVDDRGLSTVLTLGVAEGDVDLFLTEVQEGVADFKAWRARGDT